ncbi:hypothetical protein GCM10010230_56510 [Streptomyces narbonensis]|nr:hypothetical protein GCM10010230_56510 [Streptomyces narbonensis]
MTDSRPTEPAQEVLMSNTTRALVRVAPCAAPVRPPRCSPRPPVTPPSRPPDAAVPSEDPSASGRSGENCTFAPAVTPDAPCGRDGQEGLNGRADGPAAGDRGRPPGDGGNARRGPWRHHAPPRTAGTPRA